MSNDKSPANPFVNRQSTLIFLAIFTYGIYSPVIFAQGSILEEVVVTARKRGAESLQDIGGSIQAINGDDLAANAATGFNDYMRLVPSLAYNNSGPGQTQLQLRGVNTTRLNRFNANVPATVGVFFDETPLTTSGYQPDSGLIDIDRVEVLRGPQGTLFGASSMSGAIRIIPKAPDFEKFAAEGGVSASHTKHGDPNYAGHAVVNLPVADNFAARVVGFHQSNGGFIDNVYPLGGDEDYNSDDTWGGRVSLLWDASDDLTLKGTFAYQKTEADGRPDEYVPNDPMAGIAAVMQVSHLISSESLSQWQVSERLQTAKPIDETFDDETWFATLQADWTLNERLQVTSVTAYSERDILDILEDTPRFRDFALQAGAMCGAVSGACVGANNDIPIVGATNINDTKMERFSQDLRVNFELTENISGLLGFYYEDEQRLFISDLPIPGWDAWTLTPIGSFYGFIPPSVIDDSEGIDNTFHGIFDINTEQFAFYGEASLRFGAIEVTGGFRYFDYTQDTFLDWAGWAEFGRDIVDESISENGVNPKGEIVYHVNDDMLFYASVTKGFRLGAVSQVVNLGFCEGEIAGLGITELPPFVESDSLWNYEGGIKATLAGNTTVRVSGYHIDWKDARNTVNLQCGWIVELGDLQVDSDGMELEVASQLAEGLSVNFALGYNKSELSKDAGNINAFAGDRTPYVPEWTANAGFSYVYPEAFLGWDWSLRGDMSYIDDQVTELGTGGAVPLRVIPSSTTFNLYTGFSTDKWALTLYAKNLTNERVITGADFDRQQPLHYTRGRPLNIGASLRFFFN